MDPNREAIFQEMLEDFHKLKWDPETGQVHSKQIGRDGREYNDPTPMAPPVGYKRQPTMVEIIRAQVRDALLAKELAAQGVETFEEADDFDVGDDYDPSSPWENDFDPPIREVLQEAEKAVREREKKAKPATDEPPAKPKADPAPKAKPATADDPADDKNSTST